MEKEDNFQGGIDEINWEAVSDSISHVKSQQLGIYYSNMILSDMKHLAFTITRYKFASKLLMYRKDINILELGCQEALGALLFQQNLKLNHYTGIDLDERAMEWNKKNVNGNFEFICANFFNYRFKEKENYDAVVSLDVIEHIEPQKEDEFIQVVCSNLKQDGVSVIGTPSIMLSPYACEASRIGHINLYDQKRLYALMDKYFKNVFIFNMNDEIVHTGFAPMSCYIFAICCNKKG